MTQAQALDIIAKAGYPTQFNNSNYTGNGSLEYYTGWGDASLQFNGDAGANLLNTGDGAEPFILTVQNTNTSSRSFYLSQGILYTRGNESAGQLRTGTFAAINDTGTETSLTASTTNTITIEQFVGYCQINPTYLPLMQLTTNQATNQLSQSMQYYRQGMIKNDVPVTIPFRKYASQDAYNLQFQDIREPLYIDSTNIIIINVAGSSTITLNLYPLASKSQAASLRGNVLTAKRMYDNDPRAAIQLDNAQKVLATAVSSPLNTLSSIRQ